MCNNTEEKALYEMRANALRDKISALANAQEKGEKKKTIEIAKNLLDILDDETIAIKTGLSVEEVKELRKDGRGV